MSGECVQGVVSASQVNSVRWTKCRQTFVYLPGYYFLREATFFGKKSFPSHSRRSICQEKVGNYRMRCSRMQTLFSFIFVSSLVVYCDDHILLTYTIHYLVEIAGFI